MDVPVAGVDPQSGVDRAGAACSLACTAHCVLLALFPSIPAVLGLGASVGPQAEWGFTVLAVVFATAALVIGWRRRRAPLLAVLFALGIGGVLAARVMEEAEIHGSGTAVGVLAGLALVTAHLLSLRAPRRTTPKVS